jgi:hypothetical protein
MLRFLTRIACAVLGNKYSLKPLIFFAALVLVLCGASNAPDQIAGHNNSEPTKKNPVSQLSGREPPVAANPLPSPNLINVPKLNPQPIIVCDQQTRNIQSGWSLDDYIAAISAGAGLIQAVALFVTIRVLIKTARRQLRAYVAVERVHFSEVPGKPGDFTGYIEIKIRNFGSTPARNVIMKTEKFIGIERNETDVFEITDEATNHPPTSISPNADFVALIAGSDTEIDNQQWWSTSRKDHKAYVWGRIDFVDAFDIKQFTTFQLVCDFKHVTGFRLCQAGNNAS